MEDDKLITTWSKDLIETQAEWEFLDITVHNQTNDLDHFQSMLVYTVSILKTFIHFSHTASSQTMFLVLFICHENKGNPLCSFFPPGSFQFLGFFTTFMITDTYFGCRVLKLQQSNLCPVDKKKKKLHWILNVPNVYLLLIITLMIMGRSILSEKSLCSNSILQQFYKTN